MTTLYDTSEGVQQYIEMCEGIDGRRLVDELVALVPEGSRVLELGSGAGKDLALLSEHFEVTGSDRSRAFVERVRSEQPDARMLRLDARDLTPDDVFSERPFAAVYSNKVLHHLTQAELGHSFAQQRALLAPRGVALHALWPGTECTEQGGLLFQQHTVETVAELARGSFGVEKSFPYSELGFEDSLAVVLRAV